VSTVKWVDGNENDTSSVDPDQRSGAGVPRWVKVFAIVIAVVVALMVVVMIASGGEHGPGRHFSLGAGDDSAATHASLTSALALAGNVADGGELAPVGVPR
jgi:hypothetical protein